MAQYPENFIPPSVESVAPVYPEKQASDRAFYTARSYSNNPEADYQKIKTELSQTGNSELFDIAKKAWVQEQDVNKKNVVISLLGDQTVSNEEKKDALLSYSLGGYLSKDLKDKYIQKTAKEQYSESPVQVEAQKALLAKVPQLSKKLQDSVAQEKINNGAATITDYLAGTGLTIADLGIGIGTGVLGVLQAVKEWDAVAGQKLARELTEKVRTPMYKSLNPSKKAKEVNDTILGTLSYLGIPAEKIGEWVTENTGSANIGLTSKVALDPLNYVGVGTVLAVAKVGTKATKAAVNLATRRDAPILATSIANPKAAESALKQGFNDATGQTFNSMGTSNGQAIYEAVLPKILSESEEKLMPDLADYFRSRDAEFQDIFVNSRFDVNSQPLAEARIKDFSLVNDILKDSRTSGYIQNKSFFSNIDGNTYEGVAVYGKTDKYLFNSTEEALAKLVSVKEAIKDLPNELKKDVSIVDNLTGKKYVDRAIAPNEGVFPISELLTDPAFKDNRNQFSVNWAWKKDYDELGALLFGPDAVTSSLSFGPGPLKNINVSSIARSPVSNWFLNPGYLPSWVEKSFARHAPRVARDQSIISRDFDTHIAKTKHPKELDELVRIAEEGKVDHFTIDEIGAKYTYLNQQQVKNLFTSYSTWRRTTHYLHALANLKQRRDLYTDGFTRGLYLDGKYSEPINPNWKIESINSIPSKVWDYDLNSPIKFQLNEDRILEGTFDIGGKKLVQLKNPYKHEDTGHVYEFALVGGAKSSINLLPERVVPRTPGYSPIKTMEHFFVQRTPKELVINGVTVNDPTRLANYTEIIGAGATRKEAQKLAEAFSAKYPDHELTIKQDNAVNFNTVVNDLQTADNLNRHAMKRGERLPTLTGPARVEDRMVTLHKTIRSLVSQNAWDPFEKNFQEAFVASYREFLTNGEFPRILSDISPTPNASLDVMKKVEEARAIYRKYAKMKSFGTMSDQVWQKGFHMLADVIDQWKVPSDLLRNVGNKGESVFSTGKKLASVLFINLAPQRQWIVQMGTLLEMAAIYPINAINVFIDTLAYRGALMAESEMLAGISKGKSTQYFQKIFSKMSTAEQVEFKDTLAAIKKSGLMESIDANLLVQGVFTDLNTPLVRSTASKIMEAPGQVGKAVSTAGRAIGFDPAEATNRLGLWLVAKDLWKKAHPGENWNTPRAIEEISYEEFRLSGSMARAGALAYQEGILSSFMQFAAVSQKLTMNLFQDNATMLTSGQRARLAAVRLLMYGPRFGLPIGGMIDYYINQVENDETKDLLKKAERGLLDVALNALITAVTNEKADVNISKDFSPYSPMGLATIETFFEMAKIFDDKPKSPRFPSLAAVTSLEETYSKIKGWFTVKPMNTLDDYIKVFNEVAKLSSGWSNISKAAVMFAINDKYTKSGNLLGLNSTRGEAFMQILGVTTFREEDALKAGMGLSERTQEIKSMAKDIHSTLQSIYKAYPEDADKQAEYLSSLVTVLDWPEQDRLDLYMAVLDLDKNSQVTMKDSVMLKILEKTSNDNSQDLNKLRGHILRVYKDDPNVKGLFEFMQGKGNP